MNNLAETKNFKLVKLINGEDIICSIEDGNPNKTNGSIRIDYPLKMSVLPKFNEKGVTESLNLSHWVHPYTETTTFHIPNSSILLVADVSPGLSRYYEYVLRKIEQDGHEEIINNEEIFEDILDSMDVDSDSIH